MQSNRNANNLSAIDPVDAMEAYNTFRAGRSFFFILLFVGMLIVQVSFWVVDRGAVDATLAKQHDYYGMMPIVQDSQVGRTMFIAGAEESPDQFAPEQGEIPPPPSAPSDEANAEEKESAKSIALLVETSLEVSNFIMIFSAVIYCLCLLIGMKLALVGRLGGLADSAKAFFLALVAMVLIVPWQGLFHSSIAGTLFAYDELINQYIQIRETSGLAGYVLYYGRFTGFWLLTMVLLVLAQWRSHKAAQAIGERLSAVQGQIPADTAVINEGQDSISMG